MPLQESVRLILCVSLLSHAAQLLPNEVEPDGNSNGSSSTRVEMTASGFSRYCCGSKQVLPATRPA